jgi:RNA polymerase sigma-70 factor, ECF subfamily
MEKSHPRPPEATAQEVTRLLLAWREGDETALEKLIPLVYKDLRRLAHRHLHGERRNQSLQTTEIVHETYIRLVDAKKVRWQNRAHFLAVAAQLMRRILVDDARSRGALKRGGEHQHVSLDEGLTIAESPNINLVALDDALNTFASFDERKSRVVELRFFGGLSVEETAEVLSVSPETVMRDWKVAKAWLLKEMSPTTHSHEPEISKESGSSG